MPHQPWRGDADSPLWTGPRAPPALGGDADPPLWTIPPCVPPALGGDAGAALSHQALGQPHRRGAPGPRKTLTGCFSSRSLWSGCRPPSGPQPGAWRLGRGHRAPRGCPTSTLSPLCEPPSRPFVGWRPCCRPSDRRWALGRGVVLGPRCPAALCRGWAVSLCLQLLPTELALRPLLAPGGSVLKATSPPPSPVLLAGFCFSAFRCLPPQQLGQGQPPFPA